MTVGMRCHNVLGTHGYRDIVQNHANESMLLRFYVFGCAINVC